MLVMGLWGHAHFWCTLSVVKGLDTESSGKAQIYPLGNMPCARGISMKNINCHFVPRAQEDRILVIKPCASNQARLGNILVRGASQLLQGWPSSVLSCNHTTPQEALLGHPALRCGSLTHFCLIDRVCCCTLSPLSICGFQHHPLSGPIARQGQSTEKVCNCRLLSNWQSPYTFSRRGHFPTQPMVGDASPDLLVQGPNRESYRFQTEESRMERHMLFSNGSWRSSCHFQMQESRVERLLYTRAKDKAFSARACQEVCQGRKEMPNGPRREMRGFRSGIQHGTFPQLRQM